MLKCLRSSITSLASSDPKWPNSVVARPDPRARHSTPFPACPLPFRRYAACSCWTVIEELFFQFHIHCRFCFSKDEFRSWTTSNGLLCCTSCMDVHREFVANCKIRLSVPFLEFSTFLQCCNFLFCIQCTASVDGVSILRAASWHQEASLREGLCWDERSERRRHGDYREETSKKIHLIGLLDYRLKIKFWSKWVSAHNRPQFLPWPPLHLRVLHCRSAWWILNLIIIYLLYICRHSRGVQTPRHVRLPVRCRY